MNALSLHTNIQRRNAVYYIRVRVPADLLNYYAPKKEITFSLKTKDPEEAKARGRVERLKIDQQFIEARRAQKKMAAVSVPPSNLTLPSPSPLLSSFEIERLALIHLHQTLDEDAAARIRPKTPEEMEAERASYAFTDALQGIPDRHITPFGLSAQEAAKKRGRAEMFLQALPSFLAVNDMRLAEASVDSLLASEHLEIPKDSQAYYQLCLSILRAEKNAQEIILRRLNGEMIESPSMQDLLNQGIGAQSVPQNIDIVPSADNPRLSEIWMRYAEERKPVAKTVLDFGTSIRRFIEIHGDLPIKSITKSHVRIFKDTMLKFPSRIPYKLRGFTVPAILKAIDIEQDNLQTLTPKTVNEKALTAISAVMNYAVSNGFIEHTPTSKIRATKSNTNQYPSRLPYSVNDLNMIIKSSLFTQNSQHGASTCLPLSKEKCTEYKWIVLLAMFTGARLEEIGQLDVTDVGEEQGVNYIFIHADTATGRSIKNIGSKRKVPIHNKLIEFGFMKYVEERRSLNPNGKLFITLKAIMNRLTAKFSEWWTKYGKHIGIYSKQKTFHSFRHSFKRIMRDAGVDMRLTDALQGHSEEKSVSDMYGRDEDGMMYSLPTLNQALQKLHFEGVDFSELERQ